MDQKGVSTGTPAAVPLTSVKAIATTAPMTVAGLVRLFLRFFPIANSLMSTATHEHIQSRRNVGARHGA